MMNLLTALVFWQVSPAFELFQVVFAYLNALPILPCALIAPSLVAKTRNRAWLIAGFLALSPMFIENGTYTWTKAFAAFYDLTALGCIFRPGAAAISPHGRRGRVLVDRLAGALLGRGDGSLPGRPLFVFFIPPAAARMARNCCLGGDQHRHFHDLAGMVAVCLRGKSYFWFQHHSYRLGAIHLRRKPVKNCRKHLQYAGAVSAARKLHERSCVQPAPSAARSGILSRLVFRHLSN